MAQSKQETVEQFKKFVRKHPELAKGIKKEGKSWKEIFEEWSIFGEDHEIWDNYGIKRGSNSKTTGNGNGKGLQLSKILSYLQNADYETISEQLNQLNGTLTNVSEIFSIFAPEKSSNQNSQPYNNRQSPQQPQQQQMPFPGFNQAPYPPQQQPQQPQQPFQFRRD